MKEIKKDIFYVGVTDNNIDLFEGQYKVPDGVTYNSYVIIDKRIAVIDTVDIGFTNEWLNNIEKVLNDREPNYLIVQHMEPDHSANIINFINKYPSVVVVGNEKTFKMMDQFFRTEIKYKQIVQDGETLDLGAHALTFVYAPMVHWPEVMVTYDSKAKVLFSADGFGKFGKFDDLENWADEARRYFIGIVGKYGDQVQSLLKKASLLDIEMICPLHGPVLDSNLGYYLDLYDTWSSYRAETDGVLIAYTSVYGNTKKAVEILKEKLIEKGCSDVCVLDLARCDMTYAVQCAFKYGKIVLATTTYNASIFPFMNTFIEHLVERFFQNKQIAIIENGTWSPAAASVMIEKLKDSRNIEYMEPIVSIYSSLSKENIEELDVLATKLAMKDIEVKKMEKDLNSLFKIGYGLYVVTCNDGNKDNGLILNTVVQLTNEPAKVGVAINKTNYSYEVINKTKKMNVNILTTEAPFNVFETFGFASGRDVDKFADCKPLRSSNGLAVLPKYINSYMSLNVLEVVDLGTHAFFVCDIENAKVFNDIETMTYSYYQKNVKPKPQVTKSDTNQYVCLVCGYVYEGEELPDDFICPLCKHDASAFEKM